MVFLASINEEVIDLVHHLLYAASGLSILFTTTMGFSLSSAPFEHKAGLGKHAFRGVNEEKDAVNHHRVLSTSPPKSACPGVNDVDFHILVFNGVFLAIMLMPLSRSRSMESITLPPPFRWREGAGLEQGVNERSLAVVNMRDNRDILMFFLP